MEGGLRRVGRRSAWTGECIFGTWGSKPSFLNLHLGSQAVCAARSAVGGRTRWQPARTPCPEREIQWAVGRERGRGGAGRKTGSRVCAVDRK